MAIICCIICACCSGFMSAIMLCIAWESAGMPFGIAIGIPPMGAAAPPPIDPMGAAPPPIGAPPIGAFPPMGTPPIKALAGPRRTESVGGGLAEAVAVSAPPMGVSETEANRVAGSGGGGGAKGGGATPPMIWDASKSRGTSGGAWPPGRGRAPPPASGRTLDGGSGGGSSGGGPGGGSIVAARGCGGRSGGGIDGGIGGGIDGGRGGGIDGGAGGKALGIGATAGEAAACIPPAGLDSSLSMAASALISAPYFFTASVSGINSSKADRALAEAEPMTTERPFT